MFEHVTTAPPDPILGLTDAFKEDKNPSKINLSVGVYQDATGKTPILPSVKEAEKRLLAGETSKGYKPISGDPVYGTAVQKLMFGEAHPVVTGGRAFTAHTPGGTGALRVAGDYLARLHNKPTVWVSNPTWANHNAVFEAAGLSVKSYPYLDKAQRALDFDAMMATFNTMGPGDVVLLHGCCHNPSGVDPTIEQWKKIGETLAKRGIFPLVDFAYQGFGDGLSEDAAGLLALCEHVDELLICSSFSKNFGLYNERVGAITAVAKSPEHIKAVASQIKVTIRSNYSNPPAHGAAIVTTILTDPALKAQWEKEVAEMRSRINGMRHLLVDTLKVKGIARDFSFIIHQRGMFSFSGLTKEQVQKLRDQFAIYIVGSGRINVAGITDKNIGPLCDAIKAVL
ncbi:MAG: aminotransferase class I/II-fold pyridoxal phosphate-dependent enzyme [Planctomycetes bacterium]|nr:aminotransferase class I/II-fold pyridoxal phosphate-dependent enzyme [Planctomycetota bacterium]